MMLAPTVDISSAFGDNLPPVVHRRNSTNPDRASIASLSSVITCSPQPDETFLFFDDLINKVPNQVSYQVQCMMNILLMLFGSSTTSSTY